MAYSDRVEEKRKRTRTGNQIVYVRPFGNEKKNPNSEPVVSRPEIDRPTSASALQRVATPEAIEAYHNRKKEEETERYAESVELLRQSLGANATAQEQPWARNPLAQMNETVRKQQAEEMAKNKGWKRTGNQTVFATPFSPLPKPAKENTATRANAPGVWCF